MTEPVCSYSGDRDEALVMFLYDDGGAQPAADRALFEGHVRACAVCRDELDALRGVRAQLARWAPPEPRFAALADQSAIHNHSALRTPHSALSAWRAIPAWAQVAAALLVLGVSARIANLDVHYDRSGLTVRTGWSSPSRAGATSAQPAATTVAASDATAPWKADLVALERELRRELRPVQASTAAAPAAASHSTDAELLRRVRALVDESERRQKRELALRVAELMRDVNVQRQADLVKVDRALGLVENKVGVEVLKNRQQMNYFIRTSGRQ